MMKIDIDTCTTYRLALLGMWCDNVLTNTEYDRITTGLNDMVKDVEDFRKEKQEERRC